MKQDSAATPITLATSIASCYPIGFIAKAPGTWGSLPGLLIGPGVAWVAQHLLGELGLLFSSAAMLLLVALSWWSIDQTEKLWNCHDDKRIVIDEVAGQSIACAFFVLTWQQLLISFVLFRMLDILKPGWIGSIDREWPGAAGTLFDDVLAGGLIALAWALWFHLTT